MAVLMVMLAACLPPLPDAVVAETDAFVTDTAEPEPPPACDAWPVQPGDTPVFGGNALGTVASGPPQSWPIDVIRRFEVGEGHVQVTNLDGRPFVGDFLVDGGLWMEGFWTEDGAFDVRYDAPLELWRYPVEGAWTSTATFRDAVLLHVTNQGVDTWEAEVVDTVELELDGIRFTDVRVIEATLTRTLAVPSGSVSWRETAWLSPCHGVIARNREGEAMRLLP